MSRFFRADDSDSDRTSDSDSSEDEKPKVAAAAAKKPAAAPAKAAAAKPGAGVVASKWMKGSSDSDSDSESESDSDSDSGSDSDAPKAGASKFAKGGDSSSESESEEETKRVVKSHKDKRFDEMRNIVHAIENGRKINDWVAVQNEFDRLTKAFEKAKTIVDKEGIPKFYIRNLVTLEDGNKKVLENKEAVKKMNSSNAKALNTMKQKLRKYNKLFEKDIETFRANPTAESESEDEKEKKKAETVKKAGGSKYAKGAAASDESSESASESESSSDSSSSSDDGGPKKTGIAKWLKKPGAVKKVKPLPDSDDEEKKAAAAAAKKKRALLEEQASDDEGFQTVTDKKTAAQQIKDEAITLDNLFKRLKEVVEARGRKSTDKPGQVRVLLKMLSIAQTAHQKIKVLLVLIPSLFDYNASMSTHLNVETWKESAKYLDQLLSIVDETPGIIIRDNLEEDEDEAANELLAKEGKSIVILGSVNALVDRLDDEFYRSLQNIDPHTSEYIDRLRDEPTLYGMIVRSQLYCEKIVSGISEEMASMTMLRRLEHVYYKTDQLVKILDDGARKAFPSFAALPVEEPDVLITNLAIRLYKQSNERLRSRALLCHVYYHALHDRYHQARDLLLMSHLQESISHADVSTQVLYNRALVQIGLAAFRLGMIRDAQGALQEIMLSGKQKELLAQGFQMMRGREEKTPEQERLEKSRQLPFHMHINLELLECVYLVASMLLEIPYMAANRHDSGRKIISRMFRKMLSYNERQVFTGPPENTRDHVMGAARALSSGDWEKCRELINAIKVWDLMTNSGKIKEMLGRKIQEEGLRTYMFSYGIFYENLNLEDLSKMFDLSARDVHKIVSRMINNEEIAASMDETTSTVIMHSGSEQSRLQYLAAAYADKVNNLVDSNEKVMEARLSGSGAAPLEGERGGDRGRGGRGRGGRGRGGGGDRGGGYRGRGGGRGGRGGQGGDRDGGRRERY